jgi:hypothetical protein
MATASEPEPRMLTWVAGLLMGMTLVQAEGFFETTRSDFEPIMGRSGAAALGGVAFLAWVLVVWLFVTGFCRVRWVRAWFAAAERK